MVTRLENLILLRLVDNPSLINPFFFPVYPTFLQQSPLPSPLVHIFGSSWGMRGGVKLMSLEGAFW